MKRLRSLGGALAQAIGGASPDDVLAKGEALAAQGRYIEGIEYATAANRRLRDARIERRLVEWRREGYPTAPKAAGRPAWPPAMPDPFPGALLAEVSGAEALTPENLGGGILHHGSLIVRNLLTSEEAAALRDGIARTISAYDQYSEGRGDDESARWYAPIPLEQGSENLVNRYVASLEHNVLTADSPRMMFDLVDLIAAKGVDRAIEGYLGERPAISIGKSTLRCMHSRDAPADWHQDGAFLGTHVRTVNFWLTLSDCGVDALGLDMVHGRLNEIVPPGTDGAHFDWSVGQGAAERAANGRPTTSPVFKAGDAVFFDSFLLHRTPGGPQFVNKRYAIETWFFAPSTFPEGWGPLLI